MKYTTRSSDVKCSAMGESVTYETCDVCGGNDWLLEDERYPNGSGFLNYHCKGLMPGGAEYCGNVERIYYDPEDVIADEYMDSRCDREE